MIKGAVAKKDEEEGEEESGEVSHETMGFYVRVRMYTVDAHNLERVIRSPA